MAEKYFVKNTTRFYPVEGKPSNIKAIRTMDKRRPKKGEYYLSGAIVTAYRAPNDLETAYYIAQLVEVEEIKTYRIVKEVM